MFFKDFINILLLSISDIKFEKILSICMIFSLGSIFTPLFILMGLQQGILHNMIESLKSNYDSTIVTPKGYTRKSLDKKSMDLIKKESKLVIFSSMAFIYLDIKGVDNRVVALPTVSEDPLLKKNDILFPQNKNVAVLSSRLASLLGKKKGEDFTVFLIRNAIGKEENIPISFRIAGILPITDSSDIKFWIPRVLFEQYSQWKKGYAVPELGLKTGRKFLSPSYDGVVTLLEVVPEDETYRRMIAGGGMGFSQPPGLLNEAGWRISTPQKIRLWQTVNNIIYESDILNLTNRHHEQGNFGLEAVPFLDNFEVSIGDKNETLKVTILPDKKYPDNNDYSDTVYGFVSNTYGNNRNIVGKKNIYFYSGNENKKITIPVEIKTYSDISKGYIALPKTLAGKMNSAKYQLARYDTNLKDFIPVSKEVRFFRAYAKSIYDLEYLLKVITKEGERLNFKALKVPISKIEQVRIIQKLAGYMEKIYILIVAVSGPSAIFAILASVYAGIQRKRYDIAYLELLGIHPVAVFLFPVLKSLLLISGGVALAFVLYFTFGYTINQWFAHALGDADSLTRLSEEVVFILVSVIFSTGAIASLLAAISVVRIDPGEYIRE